MGFSLPSGTVRPHRELRLRVGVLLVVGAALVGVGDLNPQELVHVICRGGVTWPWCAHWQPRAASGPSFSVIGLETLGTDHSYVTWLEVSGQLLSWTTVGIGQVTIIGVVSSAGAR